MGFALCRAERGDLLLSGVATVPDRYHAGSREAVLPDLEAQLRREITKEWESRAGVHDVVVDREASEGTLGVCKYLMYI